MTIIKLSRSGNQLQVIDDDGNVFGTSVSWVYNLIEGRAKLNFLMLTKMHMSVAPDRFGKSPVWEPDEEGASITKESVTTANDSFSHKTVRDSAEKAAYKDVEDW